MSSGPQSPVKFRLEWAKLRPNGIESGLLVIPGEIQRETRELGTGKMVPDSPALTRFLNLIHPATTSADLAPLVRAERT